MSIRKHTLYNLVGSVLPLALSLVTIPIYIHLIGESRYGVLAMAWLLLGYFGLFDLGLGRATAQRIAVQANDTPAARAQTFWTALAMNSGLGVVGGLMVWPAALYFFGHVFSIEQVLRPELNATIPWMILAVPLATVSGVLSGALQGRAQFFEINVISVFSALLTQLFPLAVAWLHGPDLAWLMPAVILARLVTMSAMFQRCHRHVFAGRPRGVSRTLAKRLLQFGGWVTVTSLVGPMMVMLDRFAIGALLGARSVTYYTVPFQLGARTSILSGALSSALFPRLAAADRAEGQQLASVAIRSLAVVMTPAMVLGIFLMKPFLHLWLGADFAAHAALTGQILLLGFWINAFAAIPYAQLQAADRPHIVAQCHLIEVLPYLAALYLGLRYFGLAGAATVFGLRTFVDCVLLMYFAGSLRQSATLLAIPIALLLTSFGAICGWSVESPQWWGSAVILLLCALWWAWRRAPPDMRSFASGALKSSPSVKSELAK